MKKDKVIFKGGDAKWVRHEYISIWYYPKNRFKVAFKILFKRRFTVTILKSLFKKNRIKFLKDMYYEEREK